MPQVQPHNLLNSNYKNVIQFLIMSQFKAQTINGVDNWILGDLCKGNMFLPFVGLIPIKIFNCPFMLWGLSDNIFT